MRLCRHQFLLALPLAIAFCTASSFAAETTAGGTGGCKPHTWEASTHAGATAALPPRPEATYSVPRKKNIEAGDINCRYWDRTYGNVDHLSECKELADRHDIDISLFYELNPILESSCSRIRPNTKYCVAGFIEPLRAYDGLCGPLHNDATCLGTDKPCCNSETWTCGDRGRDCTPSLCYRGAGLCHFRVVVSTDGTCGQVEGRHTLRACGEWGNCCNLQGRCGSGPDFCGEGVCQAGECAYPDVPMLERPALLPWEYGGGPP